MFLFSLNRAKVALKLIKEDGEEYFKLDSLNRAKVALKSKKDKKEVRLE